MLELDATTDLIGGGTPLATTSGIVLPQGTLPIAHPLAPPIRPS